MRKIILAALMVLCLSALVAPSLARADGPVYCSPSPCKP